MSCTRWLDYRIFELEKRMIPPSEWATVPGHIVDIVHEDIESGYPIGFVHDDQLGWCILGTGQGPFFIYIENDPRDP